MMPAPFSKIAVLAGGPSCEREISLISGKAVYEALLKSGYSALFVDASDNFLPQLNKEAVTMVFIALHGSFGEDGTVQRLLEDAGIPYTGPGPVMSELAFDKSKAQEIFQKKGVCVPNFKVLKSPADVFGPPPFSAPFFVKPAKAGSSVGVSFVQKNGDYAEACRKAFQYSDVVIVDEWVSGRELTVSILGDKALPIVEVVPKRSFYDYEAKYGDFGTQYIFPALLTDDEAQRVGQMALRAYEALGGEVMSRVDLILSKKGDPHVLEINTIPGLTPKSLLPKAAFASGLNFDQLCVKILELSLAIRTRV